VPSIGAFWQAGGADRRNCPGGAGDSSNSFSNCEPHRLQFAGYHYRIQTVELRDELVDGRARGPRCSPPARRAGKRRALRAHLQRARSLLGVSRCDPNPVLERHGHLKLDGVIRTKVLAMGAATIAKEIDEQVSQAASKVVSALAAWRRSLLEHWAGGPPP
jgi:hypothetical protein